jgi:hypothetical protein
MERSTPSTVRGGRYIAATGETKRISEAAGFIM